MTHYEPDAFGEHLRGKMEVLGIDTVKELQERLARAEPHARGTSYTAVMQYVRGVWPSEPRREVVQALGRILRVRPDYLLFGGARTEREAELEAEVEAEARSRSPTADAARERVQALELLPYRFTVALIDHAAHRDSLERRRVRAASEDPLPSRTVAEQQAALLDHLEAAWKDIARPLARCVTLADHAVFDYLEAALHAQQLALRLPTEEKLQERLHWAEKVHPTDQEDTDG